MAGIYIHIPFCRQKCYYCDFYKTVNVTQTDSFIAALKKEAALRKAYIAKEKVKTIYFGGGTPSVLTGSQLSFIMKFLNYYFSVTPDAEITFEANPDDLTKEYLHVLKNEGINRLSIGIQSFQDEFLKKMNRRHNAEHAIESIENAASAGFSNLSADLIYGLPGLTQQQWKMSLQQMFSLPVEHLSAYHLTYHEGTPFYTWLKKGTLKELAENESVNQFNLLLDETAKAGFEQYEISNFAQNGMYSKHNSAYWTGEKYLGLGPSAHSFNGVSRRWNIAHVDGYLRGVENESGWFEEEQLSEKDKFNEYILTRIRTKWGISVREISERFGNEIGKQVKTIAGKFLQSGKMIENSGIYTLTRDGLFVSDDLMTDFMII
ncbi:oxygen-independent coproporphyrinogen-3 oxidase [Mariniphaga anaerophila]|uniref:Heme chaperone HemW n=1 Tax=Mariniphaga anaerophila TaxID=1484053 RepID=A0A1M5EKC6_9BACT|nr:radical SAM family heme chaperone HemW [Mariniphaga anaerophila]SHF79570.1 oxygen-independent coproporphyrinogen-3 oxidase [Mariniphaga anaerophila]